MIDGIIEDDLAGIMAQERLETLEGEEALVSGGAGFLGSWICDVLVRAGARVTCVDNLCTGRLENVDHLIGRENFRFIRSDIGRYSSRESFDFIFHLASRASPEEYQKRPIETLLANSLGTRRVLELARASGGRVLFASSSEVYGDSKVIPTPEDYWGHVNPIGVRSCYDEGKRFGEALCVAYSRQYGLDARIARIFNSYGPRIRGDGYYARAVSRFITQACSNSDITIYGDGSQTRSFCYVTDTVRGLLRILLHDGAKGGVFNVGYGREMSIMELADLIRRISGSRSKFSHHPLPEDDPSRRCPDGTKAERVLSWRPEVDVSKGMKRTVEWFSKRPKGPR